jgi:hypothetical protein
MHTALVDDDIALSMEQAGIDAAMMDVIGSQDTITQVYHLRRSVDDFEATLESLVKTNMKVVPTSSSVCTTAACWVSGMPWRCSSATCRMPWCWWW